MAVVSFPATFIGFIGREPEIATITELLAQTRLLTITCLDGVGKTRLAVVVAAGLSDAFPDGIVFVALAPISDPRLVAPTIVSPLQLADAPGISPQERLIERLAGTRVLLVLANDEQVIAAAPVVADLSHPTGTSPPLRGCSACQASASRGGNAAIRRV
jgi:predicted ATPase